ncbi:hypothetical protein J3A83DRAFT_4263886 [Scleroderma citrinum]
MKNSQTLSVPQTFTATFVPSWVNFFSSNTVVIPSNLVFGLGPDVHFCKHPLAYHHETLFCLFGVQSSFIYIATITKSDECG